MKKIIAYIFAPLLFAVSVLSATTAQADIVCPLGNDIYGFNYDLIYQRAIGDQDFNLLPPVGPFTIDKTKQALNPYLPPSLEMLAPAADETLRLWTYGSERFAVSRNQRGNDLPYLLGGFSYRAGEHISVLSFFNLDRAKAIDPAYTGKKYRGLAGNIESAAMYLNFGKFNFTLGRQRVFWGPQRASLLISETAEPLDMLSASYSAGRLTFNFLFARLDGSIATAIDSANFPNATFNDNRYLTAHRLDLRLHHRLRVGLFEAVTYGGEGRPPELYYLNPLQFFHAAQLNENEDDNTMLGIDFTALAGNRVSIYGQLLVDDFQIDNNSQADQEPPEFGVMCGVFRSGRIGSYVPDIKLEYVRITNRTYHQLQPRNRYLYRNRLIGHPLDNDADSLSFKLRFWPRRQFYAEFESAYLRRGEGSVHKDYDQPWLAASGDYSESFPTGTVEKSVLFAVRAKGYLPLSAYTRRHIFANLAIGWGKVSNRFNIEGADYWPLGIDCSISWLGFTDFDVNK